MESGTPCLENPPAPRNARVFCSGSERSFLLSPCPSPSLLPRTCNVHCLPGHQFPGGETQATLTCTEGAWQTVGDCEGQANTSLHENRTLLSQMCVVRPVRTAAAAFPATSACVESTSVALSASTVSLTLSSPVWSVSPCPCQYGQSHPFLASMLRSTLSLPVQSVPPCPYQ